MFEQIIILQHCVIVSLCSYCCCCSGFCTDNTDASLLRWFLEYIKIFTLHSRWKFRGFSSSAEYQSQSYTKGASSLKAKKRLCLAITMVVVGSISSLRWLWVAFMLQHRRAFTITSGVNDSLIELRWSSWCLLRDYLVISYLKFLPQVHESSANFNQNDQK